MNNLLTLYNLIEETWIAERNIPAGNLNYFDELCFELYSFIGETWKAERNIPFSVPECISECHSRCFPYNNNIDIPSYTSYFYLLPLALGSYIFVYIICAFCIDPTHLELIEQGPGIILYLDTSCPILLDPGALAERTFFRLIDEWDTFEGFFFHHFNLEFNIVDWFNIHYVRFTAPQGLINAVGDSYFNGHYIHMTIYPFFSETALWFKYSFLLIPLV